MPDQDRLCEALLARLFTDAVFRAEFVKEPARVCREFGLDETSVACFVRSDAVGLELAARSYSHKRNGSARRKSR